MSKQANNRGRSMGLNTKNESEDELLGLSAPPLLDKKSSVLKVPKEMLGAMSKEETKAHLEAN